ncbi:MAG TPA: LuxR C-terminal-related transcriptional regulator, partial [Actinomycetota bacterium]|nr:LuxR C-terminal-related transcriptional regulator [Actinomycetota bacterium]
GGPAANDDIEAAIDSGAIEGNGGVLRLTHPLLASILRSESSARTRRDIHRRLAGAVVDQEERARHLALAADGPDEAVASELEDAARRAHSRGAPDAAAQLAMLARELTPSERSEDRIHRSVHAGEYAFEAGDLGQATTLLEQAVATAPPGWMQAEALLFLARVRYHSRDVLTARALAEQALEESGPEHPDLTTRIHLELAIDADAIGDRGSARVHASAAVHLAEARGDGAVLAESLSLLGLNDFLAGDGVQLDMMTRAVALEGTSGGVRPLRSPTFRMACMLLWSDDLASARSTFGDLEKRCREGGDDGSLAVILFLLAQLECRAGNWADASRRADESCTITAWTGQQPYLAHALAARALVDGHLGNAEAARTAAQRGLDIARTSGLVQAAGLNLSALGFLELSLGNAKEAHRVLWPLAERMRDAGLGDPGMLRFLPNEIEALVALGEADTARPLLASFLARASALGRTWALATGERCRGFLAASAGESPAALEAFARALETHQELDEPFELGRTLLAQGQVLRRAKKWRLARDSLGRSLEIFEHLGATLWVEKAVVEMVRIGGRAPRPTDLTPTEQNLAQLVASGLTNREAARALFVSVSTVEASLRRIYSKLGVRSRTELARRLTELQPPANPIGPITPASR